MEKEDSETYLYLEIHNFDLVVETFNFVTIKLNKKIIRLPKRFINDSESILTQSKKENVIVLEIPFDIFFSLLDKDVLAASKAPMVQ